MLEQRIRKRVADTVRVGQLITLAVSATPIVLLLGGSFLQWPVAGQAVRPVSYALLAGAGACAAVRLVLPALMQQAAQRRSAGPAQADDTLAAELLRAWLVQTVICVALLESAAVLAAVAYLLNRTTASLAITIAFTIWLLMHFPLESSVAQRLEGQLRAMRADQ